MNAQALLALSPLLVVAGGSVLLMLLIAFRRDHNASAALTALVLLAALVAGLTAPPAAAITPLLTFDDYARTVQILIFAGGLGVTALLHGYLRELEQPEEMYLLLLLALLGGGTLAAAQHAAALLLGLEILTVSLFGMIAYTRRRRASLEAGIKYLVLSAVSSAILLFGLALLYAAGGSLGFAELAARLPALAGEDLIIARLGGALLLAGLAFKLSLVPFHLWTPDVYEGAPAPVTALLATVSKGAVAAVLLRVLSQIDIGAGLLLALLVIAVLTILAGNLLALLAPNVKRLLAYSSIAHLGYLLVPFITGGPLAAEALLYYLVAYFIMTLGAFGVVARLSSPDSERDAVDFADYRCLFWRRPGLACVLTPMLLALAGVPLTAGFLAKFYILAVAVDAHAWVLATAVVVGSGIGLYYYLRLTIELFRRDETPGPGRVARPEAGKQNQDHTGPGLRPANGVADRRAVPAAATLTVLLVLLFWFGVWPQGLMAWLTGAGL